MSQQVEFPVGAQVWARMPEPLRDARTAIGSDTEVLSWVEGHERRGNMLYYRCKAPESGGIWTFCPNEVVPGVMSIRAPLTHGAQFELGQTVRVKKRVEWQISGGKEVQKRGRVAAAWCKRVQGADGYFLDYSYWIDFGNDQALPRNWYPQNDLEY